MVLFCLLIYCHIWPQKTKRESATRLKFPPRFPRPGAVYLESPQAVAWNRDLRLWKVKGMQIAYSDQEAQASTHHLKLVYSVRSRELILLSPFVKIHFEMHLLGGETLLLPLPRESSKIPLKNCVTSVFVYLFHIIFQTVWSIFFRLFLNLKKKKRFHFTCVMLEPCRLLGFS